MGVVVRNTGRAKLNLRYGVSLPPGDTEVDCEAWGKCRVDPITRHYLEYQSILVVRNSADDLPNPEPEMPSDADVESPEDGPGILDMKAKDAIAFIKGCSLTSDLGFMLMHEERTTVLSALHKRLEELGPSED